MFRKLLCWLGSHKINEDEWRDQFGWGEKYLGQTNWCYRCGKLITRK
jgi:hypothetical protein